MANRIVSVHAGIYGIGIYAIMLPSSGFSVAHYCCSCLVYVWEALSTVLAYTVDYDYKHPFFRNDKHAQTGNGLLHLFILVLRTRIYSNISHSQPIPVQQVSILQKFASDSIFQTFLRNF